MYLTNITDEYDNITSINYTDYDNISFANCTNNESNIDIIIPALIFTIPCGLSFLCLTSLMVYTLIKIFFKDKYKWRSFFIQLIQLCVS